MKIKPFLRKVRDRLYPVYTEIRTTINAITSYVRVQKPVVAVFGRPFVRSNDTIELDITYACTLACYNCNRSVRQAPSGDNISADKVAAFVEESIRNNKKWKRIRLLGGEPTAHGKILHIMNSLVEYKKNFSPETVIELHTNGYGKRPAKIVPLVPEEIEIISTEKEGDINSFYPFNAAPVDSPLYKFADFSQGCRVPVECGVGLTPYGYYMCACAGAIDRIVGLDIGRKEMPVDDDMMIDQMEKLCGYCGSFRTGGYHFRGFVEEEIMSPTWTELYGKWKQQKPQMSRY